MELGSKAEWVGAIGTVLAFAAVAYQIISDARRRNKIAEQAQAVAVSSWLPNAEGSPMPQAKILNNSDLPIYGAIISVVAIQGAFPFDGRKSPLRHSMFSVVPPGEHKVRIDWGGGAMGVRFSTELCFKDAAGKVWIRNGRGELRRLNENPLRYYGIDEPVDWQTVTS